MSDMRTHRECLAWAAGFFDGEGCVHYSKRAEGRGQSIQVVVTNTHLPALERFHAAVCGRGKISRSGGTNMPAYCWRAGSFEVGQAVMAMLWPFLCEEKRERFAFAFTAMKDNRRHNKTSALLARFRGARRKAA